MVHIDPINKEHRRYNEIERVIAGLVRQDKMIHGFHDLRVSEDADGLKIEFDITVEQKTAEGQIEEIKQGG